MLKYSCCEYELQLTIRLLSAQNAQKKKKINDTFFPHQTLILREQSQVFRILCWGLFFFLISTLWTVYRCCWLQFSVNQSYYILVSCSSSNPTANSLDSDSVCLESSLQLEFWTHKWLFFFWFMGFSGNMTCQSAAAVSRLPNILQSLHLNDDFPFMQLSLQATLAHTITDLTRMLFQLGSWYI